MNIDLKNANGQGFHVTLDKGINTASFQVTAPFKRSQLKVASDPSTVGYSKINVLLENADTGEVIGEDAYTADAGNVRGTKVYATPPGNYLATLNCSASIKTALVPYHLK